MIDDKVYNILLTSVVKKMQSRYNNISKSLVKFRSEIIKTHRTVCLLPYYMFVIESKKRQEPQTFLPIKSDINLISTLIRPKEIQTFPDLSMMVQETSFLINYLVNNPTDLAREIVNAKNNLENLDYYHLMFQIVPSIFGFFHSHEHLSAASNFYQIVIGLISSDNPRNSIRILQPFLNSPATYRYIEYVMTKFFKKIILDKSYNNITEISAKDKNSYSYREYILHQNKNTKRLLYYLTKGASLLPDEILQIFREIRTKYIDKWDDKLWYKLVFTIFINPHVNRWARSHFFNHDNNIPSSISQTPSPSKVSQTLKISSLPKAPIALIPKSPISSFPTTIIPLAVNSDSPHQTKLHKLDIINDILSNVMNKLFKRDFDFLLDTLCSVRSTYKPPRMYKCFDDFSIQFYMMTNDMIVLVNFLHERNILPSFTKFNLFQGVADEYLDGLFYMNVYQSPPTEKVVRIEDPIVFPRIQIDQDVIKKFNDQIEYRSRLASLQSLAYSDGANVENFALDKSAEDAPFHEYVQTHIAIELANAAESFEEFIEWERLFNEVKKWNSLSSEYENLLLLAYLAHLQKMPQLFEYLPNKVKLLNQLAVVEEKDFNGIFEKVFSFSDEWDSYIRTLMLNRQKNITDVFSDDNDGYYQKVPVIFEPYSIEDPRATKHTQFVKKLEQIKFSNCFPKFFFKALSTFSMIPLVSLPEKYILFMKFLAVIDSFFPKDDNTLFLLLIQKISGSLLMKTFIEISTVAIHNDRCFSCISVSEMTKWQRFENLIYQTVAENNQMFQKILKCQMYSQDVFDKWKAEPPSGKNKLFKKNRSTSILIE